MEEEDISKKNDPTYLGKATTPKVEEKKEGSTFEKLMELEKKSEDGNTQVNRMEEQNVTPTPEELKNTEINIVAGLTPPKEALESGSTELDKAKEPVTADKSDTVASEGWRDIGVLVQFKTTPKNGGTFLKALFKENLKEIKYMRNLRFVIECDKEKLKTDPVYAEAHHKKVKALESIRDDLRVDVAFPLDAIETYLERLLENIQNNGFKTRSGGLDRFSTQTVRAINSLCNNHLAKYEEVSGGKNKKEQKSQTEVKKETVWIEI